MAHEADDSAQASSTARVVTHPFHDFCGYQKTNNRSHVIAEGQPQPVFYSFPAGIMKEFSDLTRPPLRLNSIHVPIPHVRPSLFCPVSNHVERLTLSSLFRSSQIASPIFLLFFSLSRSA